ncbi:hypothetical protein V2J09_013945 [Rumex salicifolius]
MLMQSSVSLVNIQMGKKNRDRRITTESTRRRNRDDPSEQPDSEDEFAATASRERRSITIFVVFFIVLPAVSILIYALYIQSPTNPKTPISASDSYVFRQGLVKADLSYEDILNEHNKVSESNSSRSFINPVLAYITPWNSIGYDLAKSFNSKFTHLSPVWYDLKSQGKELVLEGRHNADTGWISELRKKGDAKVLPRVVIEVHPNDLLRKKKQRDKAIDLIITECKEMGYDGVVIESWSRWTTILHDASMRKRALQFIRQIGETLHTVSSNEKDKQPLELIYVIGSPNPEKLQNHDFGPEDLKSLSGAVDGFSLMTYDFSNPYNPGPNAPLKWIHSILQLLLHNADKSLARKVFLGLNFYGYDFLLSEGGGAQAVTGSDYMKLLKQHKPGIVWEKNIAEHYFVYNDDQQRQHAVFYPSLLSISTRLEEARSLGASISIWEIGQGLDYFFDLL